MAGEYPDVAIACTGGGSNLPGSRTFARRITEASRDSRTIYLSMGLPQARATLVDCLSRVPGDAILLTDRALAGADTVATAFHHLSDQQRALPPWRRLLRPGGWLPLAVWGTTSANRLMRLFVDAVAVAEAAPPPEVPIGPPMTLSDDAYHEGDVFADRPSPPPAKRERATWSSMESTCTRGRTPSSLDTPYQLAETLTVGHQSRWVGPRAATLGTRPRVGEH
jgi:SAM-dependent methyltransferase